MKFIKSLGLMSGTSMDGLDCGLFDIALSHDYQLEWHCQYFETIPYHKSTRRMIINALCGDEKNIMETHFQLGR